MAMNREESAFGHVSRVRGIVFKHLTLGAALFGILTLAVLLVYVTTDALGLQTAAPEWVFTFVATLVLPTLALWLYRSGQRTVAIQAGAALVGGPIATYVLFAALEALGYGIPTLTWQTAYLFAVVVPTVGATIYSASLAPVGGVASGVVGRLLGGTALGIALVVLFMVFETKVWFLAYTLGLLPGIGLLVLARRYPDSTISLFPTPVTLAGFVVAVQYTSLFVVPLLKWEKLLWSVALPAAAMAAVLLDERRSRPRAVLGGALCFVAMAVGSVLLGSRWISWADGLLLLVPIVVPTGLFVERTIRQRDGIAGLLAPIVIVCGAFLGLQVVEVLGIAQPTPWLDWGFLTSPHSQFPENAGLYPGIVGSVLIVALVAVFSFSFGVGTAIFLEDYAPDTGWTGRIIRLIQINIANLAAVPSVVYGLLGLGLLVNVSYTIPGTGYTYTGIGAGLVMTASITLTLLILPITIISAQEAIRAVPDEMRRGSYAMGATRWQTTKNVVIPEALPGIFTGTILALGRAIGETAPLLFIGIPDTAFSATEGLFDKTTAMPMQVFQWYQYPDPAFQRGVLAAGVVTLLGTLLLMNGTAIVLRDRYQ